LVATATRLGGRVFKTMGDGVLIEFASPVAAVTCAHEVQKTLSERWIAEPEERRVRLRIGINLGDVVARPDGDLYGDGVNVAARLEPLAAPGGIVISAKVYDELQGRLALAWQDRGEQPLKNITRPVRVYARGPEPAASARPANSPTKPSIAVLPFDNMSGDPEQDYFADGMVEDIITALSRFKELVVIARNSSFVYKGRAVDITEVARDLHVQYVLEGSVRKAGNRIRITGQLIDAATRAHLWADRFDGELRDVFELQDQITESVVGALAPTLRQAEIERARRKPAENLEAYDYLLRALPHLLANTITEAPEAIRLLTEALRLDPDYVQAHAHIAMAYANIFRSAVGPERERTGALGLSHARRVIALGTGDANTLAVAGFFLMILGQDVAAARSAVDKAVALNSNSAVALTYRSVVLGISGQAQAAIADAQKAMRLNPTDPSSFLPQMAMVLANLELGDNDEAANWARKVAQINPRYPVSYIFLMVAECRRGRPEEAAAQVDELAAIIPDFGPERLASMFSVYPPELREASLATLRAAGFLSDP
jgi:TolB-like protein